MADFSPGFDPGISLAVSAPQAAAPPSALDSIGAAVGIRNANNANTLFQNTQAARYKLGRIMATAPSVEAGLAAAQKDPDVSAFVPDLLATMEGNQTSQLGRQATTQQLATSGLATMEQASAAAINHPEFASTLQPAIMSTVAPAAQPMVDQSTRLLDKAMYGGTPQENAQAQFALSTVFGGDPSKMRNMLNQVDPSVTNVPNSTGGLTTSIIGSAGGAPTTIQPLSTAPVPLAPLPGANGLGGMPAPAPGPTLGQSPGTAQQAMFAGQASNEVQTQSNVAQAASGLPTMINRTNLLLDALKQVPTGGGAKTAAGFAQFAQTLQRAGFNISDAQINSIAGGDLGALQVVNTEVGQLLAQQAASIFKGTGAEPSAHYINTQIDSLSGNSDPNAIKRVLTNVQTNLEVQADKVKAYQDIWQPGVAAGKPGFTPGNFDAYYLDHVYDPKKFANNQGPIASFLGSPEQDAGVSSGAGLAVGTVKSGRGGIQYKFTGGDPKSKSSWTQVE